MSDYYESKFRQSCDSMRACLWSLTGIILIAILALLTACSTVKDSEVAQDSRKVSELYSRMDSMIRSSYSWQQDLYSRQTSLIDSFKQRERNDSSHSVVMNEKGDTVKEKIVIYRYLENIHSSEKSETEFLMLKIERLDSMLNLSLEKQAVTDSLLHEHEKYVEVEKKQSLKDRLATFIEDATIGVIIFVLVIIVIRLVRKRLTPL